jgi:hypothetical protein
MTFYFQGHPKHKKRNLTRKLRLSAAGDSPKTGSLYDALPVYFFGIYKSVILPNPISAANIAVSDKVGCAWMVSAKSSRSAPISIASTVSASNSPAFTPTMPALEHDGFVAFLDALLQRLDDIAIGGGNQAIGEFEHADIGTQCGIDARHFQTNDATANDQHAFGDLTQFEYARRIDQARVVIWKAVDFCNG